MYLGGKLWVSLRIIRVFASPSKICFNPDDGGDHFMLQIQIEHSNVLRFWLVEIFRSLVFLLIIALISILTIFSQSYSGLERGRSKDMLNAVKNELKSNYYDPKFHGIDLDSRFKIAEEKLNAATSMGQAFGIIAQTVLDLNDSHTTFYPPKRTSEVKYDWRMQMNGDKCFVTSVKPKSLAESVGLKSGDEILKIEGFKPTKKDLWKIHYYFNTISPRESINLVIQHPQAKETIEMNIVSKVTALKGVLDIKDLIRNSELGSDRLIENLFVKVGNTVIWKMPSFSIDPASIAAIMNGEIMPSNNLILDLRGNGGGYVSTLEELAGFFVDNDTKIAELKGRKEMKPQMAKTRGKNIYKGNIIVLIDSNSASASEIFARFMQLQQRGVVIGDQSAGAVMQSITVSMQLGADQIIPYGMSMTNADVIMNDGKSLEHVGVTPQLLMIPTADDLALQRDPVLSTALGLFEQKVSSDQAGKFFPYKWKEIFAN
jgi:C-terminal processing protease CtpA/Prc